MSFRRPRRLADSPSSSRDRGFLSKNDREFLRTSEDEINITEGAQFNARRRIVNRTRDALRDFRIVYEYLGDKDRSKVFYTPSERTQTPLDIDETSTRSEQLTDWLLRINDPEDIDVAIGSWCALAFIYEQVGADEFDQMLTQALSHVLTSTRKVGGTMPHAAGLRVSLDVNRTDTTTPNEIGQKVALGESASLTRAESIALLHVVRNTGGRLPDSRQEFLNQYYEFMENDYPDIDPDSNGIAFTIEPFDVIVR